MAASYSEQFKIDNPSYRGVTCCEEWNCFCKFLEDLKILKNEYNFPQDGSVELHIDKDILSKNCKYYSLETCVLIPKELNCVFVKNDNRRGDLPIGVSFNKHNKKYQASLNMKLLNKSQKTLGYFDTIEQCFECYKQAKESYLKDIAELYVRRGWISRESRLYKTLYNYQIEIED